MVISQNNRVVTFWSEKEMEDQLNAATFTAPFVISAKGGFFTWATQNPDGQFISPEAQLVLDRMVNLSDIEKDAIVTFINQEVANGNWALVDEFFCFALGLTNNLIGFKDKTATNNGATFDINGATFAGAQDIDTTYALNSGGNFVQDNALIGAFVKTRTGAGNVDLLTNSGNFNGCKIIETSPNLVPQINTNGAFLYASAFASNKLYVLIRTASNASSIYEDGSEVINSAIVSNSLTANTLKVGLGFNGGGFEGVVSSALIGGGIGFDQAAHNTNLRAFLTELGTLP